MSDLGNRRKSALELGDRRSVLVIHRHVDEHLEAATDPAWVNDGSIAADCARLLQGPEAMVAGRDGEVRTLGQCGYGQTSLSL